MAYRKLGRDNKHRRSMLATLTKQVVENEITADISKYIGLYNILQITTYMWIKKERRMTFVLLFSNINDKHRYLNAAK